MNEIKLFENKDMCCGCGACVNVCPQKAIKMITDEYGFQYPQINTKKCVKCGLCKRMCSYQNKNQDVNVPLEAYAAFCECEELIMNSASGGVFADIAKGFIENNGIVYGCTMDESFGKLSIYHKRIDKDEKLIELQGSKYVQSNMNNVYARVREDLKNNRIVLFSGTPCQVAAIKKYVENIEEKKNLFTIDIICHGVPSEKFFQDYIEILEKKIKGKIIEIKFRDKTEGWGLKGKIKYISKKNNRVSEKIIFSHLSSYYKLFLNSTIYRENCYSCKYAGKERSGDITLGDYWGIERQHPEYMKSNGGVIESEKGISCILVNSEKGKKLLDKYSVKLIKKVSSFEKVAEYNAQLRSPSIMNPNRKDIMELYKKGGYSEVEKYFQKSIGRKRVLYYFWNKLPRKVQLKLKKKG